MRSQAPQTTRLGILPTLLAFVSLGATLSTGLSHAADGASMPVRQTVARFLESGRPPLTAYRARRHLEASTRGGAFKAQVEAWTNLNPDGTFTFEIIRERVLRVALLEEQRGRIATHPAESALIPANYDFQVDEAKGKGDSGGVCRASVRADRWRQGSGRDAFPRRRATRRRLLVFYDVPLRHDQRPQTRRGVTGHAFCVALTRAPARRAWRGASTKVPIPFQ